MQSLPQRQRAGDGINTIKAQVAATHNPLFPFSSPRSDPSTPSLTFNEGDSIDDKDEWQSERFSEYQESQIGANRTTLVTREGLHKKPRPSLQIVTSLSPPQPRSGNIVFNRVAARQPKEKKNRARSIISQKGVKVLFSPTGQRDSAQAIADLKSLIKSKREKKSNDARILRAIGNANNKRGVVSDEPGTILIGLQVPEHKASTDQLTANSGHAASLCNPPTPKIVVTPADEVPKNSYFGLSSGKVEQDVKSGSPSSLYSRSISQFYQQGNSRNATVQVQPSRPLQNHVQAKQRSSSESPQDDSTESSDTARPKSQGWWNLMLSPMLSRAGTLKRAAENKDIPPVPPIPNDSERFMAVHTPMTVMSPETPRRLGLAAVHLDSATGSDEFSDDQTIYEDSQSDTDETTPAVPRDCLDSKPQNAAMPGARGGGLADEYYHACAIEQLAGIAYFECINHSCAERLPKFVSLPKETEEGANAGASTSMDQNTQSPYKGLFINIPRAISPQHTAVVVEDIEATKGQSPSILGRLTKTHSPRTPMESEMDVGEIVSPNVRQANAATFTKAKAVNSRDPSPAPTVSSTKPADKKIDVCPIPVIPQQNLVMSPEILSPETNRSIAPVGALPMAPIQAQPANVTVPLMAPVPQISHALVAPYQPPPHTFTYYPHEQNGQYQFVAPAAQHFPATHYVTPYDTIQTDQAGADGKQMLPKAITDEAQQKVDIEQSGRDSKDEHAEHKQKSRKHRKVFAGAFCCSGRSKANQDNKSKNRRWTILISIVLIILIALCILFALLFSRGSGDANPIDSQWLNLSGYPPMPTGISTIAQPNLAASQDQCAPPNLLWSCALPKEDQAGIIPNKPEQPNFRFQIRFHNGTAGVPANMTISLDGRESGTSADELFVPNPAAPSQQDQTFLGNTTDNVTTPFDGELTPFFITFLPAISETLTANSTSKLETRDSTDSSDSDVGSGSSDSSDSLNSIPPPSLGPDGLAASASLLPTGTNPFPISQPIKLFNRGLSDEHYGFYMYYDKSIFLSSFLVENGTAVKNTAVTTDSDSNGGSTKQTATARCTWSQTRFLVKMFTNPTFGGKVFPRSASNTTVSSNANNTSSSADDFDRPGSFPYPTTILLDRHGGDINRKFLYCYGMENENIISTNRTLFTEFRSFGGVPVNPAPLLLNHNESLPGTFNEGIDGGSGGCGCTWQNWA